MSQENDITVQGREDENDLHGFVIQNCSKFKAVKKKANILWEVLKELFQDCNHGMFYD